MFGWGEKGEEGKFGGEGGGGCFFHCLVEERKGRGRKNWMGDIPLGLTNIDPPESRGK
jgi:hypothetical protein